ncbi:MAG: hypothetical protein AVDCRST_MAG08-1028, partial [uncultured Acetobacteraceae bacterium]
GRRRSGGGAGLAERRPRDGRGARPDHPDRGHARPDRTRGPAL